MAGKLDEAEKNNQDTSSLHGQNIRLEARAWHGLITNQNFCELISLSLNYCVFNEGLRLHGYLITPSSVYLMAHHEDDEFRKILHVFYQEVLSNLEQQFKERELHYSLELQKRDLFIESRLYKGPISDLMLGEKIDLPYFSAKIAFLKEHIVYHKYCSAFDYSGAIGPVVIRLMY